MASQEFLEAAKEFVGSGVAPDEPYQPDKTYRFYLSGFGNSVSLAEWEPTVRNGEPVDTMEQEIDIDEWLGAIAFCNDIDVSEDDLWEMWLALQTAVEERDAKRWA